MQCKDGGYPTKWKYCLFYTFILDCHIISDALPPDFIFLHFAQIALPIRVMHMLGASKLFITNAAGAVNASYEAGDMILIKDHIDFSSIVGLNPLTGPNDERSVVCSACS